MYSNKILNLQKSTTMLNTCTKKSGNLFKAPRNLSADDSQGLCLCRNFGNSAGLDLMLGFEIAL